MRNRIFGAIGVLWGGLILLGRVASDRHLDGPAAYAAGQMAGLIFAALLVVVGLFYVIRGGGISKNKTILTR